MTRDDMLADVRERLGEATENFWSDKFIIRHLIQGARRFNNEERWHWLYTVKTGVAVPADTPTITLSTDTPMNRQFGLRLVKVSDTSYDVYPKRVEVRHAFKLRQQNSTAGEPKWFYLLKAAANPATPDSDTNTAVVVNLVPTPSEAWTAEYVYLQDHPGLIGTTAGDSGAGTEPRMPEAYHEAVIAWATAKCWLKELNGERKAQSEFNVYNTVLEQARRDQQQLGLDEQVAWGEDDRTQLLVNPLHRVLFSGGPLGG